MSRRLSVCYAAPGHTLAPTAGGTRNILALAAALSEWADVAVAFRTVPALPGAPPFRVLPIEPGPAGGGGPGEDDAVRGVNPVRHLAYLRRLRAFARRWAPSFDVVLEKGWRLSGCLCAAFGRHHVPAVLVENDLRAWTGGVRDPRTAVKYVLHRAAERWVRAQARRVPVIAETEELKAALVRARGAAPDQVEVVGLGVDHALFRPREQAACRVALGLDPAPTLLLYVGGMDRYHDLGPVIDALARVRPCALELLVVGDGGHRLAYEAAARGGGAPVRFVGRVPHPLVPRYIAAADLCIAPYRAAAFPGGAVTFSTLKIPEYMACARPVASIPSGHITRLVADGVSGFLFPNETAAWTSFLAAPPSRRQLAGMREAAAKAVESVSWSATAAGYLKVCRRLIETGRTPR